MVPYNGETISLFDGSDWAPVTASGTSVSISTAALASGFPYDVYCYSNAGVPTLEFSTKWTDINTRADAIQYLNGVPVKSGATTRRFIGTVWARNSGVIDDSRQYRGVWNWDNRVLTPMDFNAVSGHTYLSSGNKRIWNNNSGNQIWWIQGIGGIGAQMSIFMGIYRNTGTGYSVSDVVTNAAIDGIQVSTQSASTEYKYGAGWIQCITGLNWAYVNEYNTASGNFGGTDMRIYNLIEG